MLRDRAEKADDITEEMFAQVREEHRLLVNEFLDISKGSLSPKTLIQYRSALYHFFWWVHEVLNDKNLNKITKRDFLRYISFLQNRGLSSSSISLKKAAVSSFNNYIENIVADDDENYKSFKNFTRGLPSIPKNQVYNKVKITKEEYDLMMETLLDDENYLGAAWVATAFNVGARRAEIPQFKTEILSYPIPDGKSYVFSHFIRLKGKGEDGKQRKYMINTDALRYMKLWVEKRGYDHEYIFTTRYGGEIKPISDGWADDFCKNVLSDILGRRINPHLFKASCITYLLEVKKVSLELVSKHIAQHEDVSTTIKHYDLREFEEERDQIFS